MMHDRRIALLISRVEQFKITYTRRKGVGWVIFSFHSSSKFDVSTIFVVIIKNTSYVRMSEKKCLFYTYEVETDQSLAFLDVQLTRSSERQTFETNIYWKPTFTGLMTKWNWFVPMNCKRAGIDSMTRSAWSICTTYQSLTTEFDEIWRIGQANKYRLSFINVHIGIE
jgi:hypothetical protein